MKAWRSFAGTIAFLVAIPPVLSAQWPASPSASAPRTPDGKPNLSAPAPRTPDGRPDLSGIWNNQFFSGPPAAQGRASALLMHTDTDQRAARVD
jgi:hypothetical protein